MTDNGIFWLEIAPGWAARGIGLRLRQPEDLGFLRDLYRSTRAGEAAAAGLQPFAAAVFLNSQFELQCRHYDQHYTLSGQRLIILEQQHPIGRVELWANSIQASDRPQRLDLRLVDISLLPSWRGQGLGTELLAALQRSAAAHGRSISLHVDKLNRAFRLYSRLGFRKVADTGASWRLEWQP